MRIALLAVAVTAALAASAVAQTSAPAPFRCPDTIQVAEPPSGPAGFNPDAARAEHRFLQVTFFEGAQSDRSGRLSPDANRHLDVRNAMSPTVTQVFSFSDPRSRPVYARCTYRDTAAALLIDVPATITRCILTFAYDRRTGAIGTPDRPQEVDCQ
jgi:hypothetical protein